MIFTFRLVTLLLIAPAVSGCVAAAAIPVLAGGSMLNSDAIKGERTASSDAPAERTPEPVGRPAQIGYVVTELAALPAPGTSDIASATQARAASRSFDAFYGYALAQASLDPLETPMRSALLEAPGSLEPVRQHCVAGDALVLIDLDPAGSVFSAAEHGTASSALAQVLAVLRMRGLGVAWLSDASIDDESAIRTALRVAELDPTGVDRLLLADGKSTKQERRQALAGDACPVAVAGDAPADFDELYAYLKNPDAALALNEMFGAGWFLTPNPFD